MICTIVEAYVIVHRPHIKVGKYYEGEEVKRHEMRVTNLETTQVSM